MLLVNENMKVYTDYIISGFLIYISVSSFDGRSKTLRDY